MTKGATGSVFGTRGTRRWAGETDADGEGEERDSSPNTTVVLMQLFSPMAVNVDICNSSITPGRLWWQLVEFGHAPTVARHPRI